MEQHQHGPAERLINVALSFAPHLAHNRTGIEVDGTWVPAIYKVEGDQRIVYTRTKIGRRSELRRHGVLNERFWRPAGLFALACAQLYRQIHSIYALDQELLARWASYAAAQDHRDLKVALAAFLLVQSRKGDFIREGGEILFRDVDYRDVGEGLFFHRSFSPKMVARVGDFLRLPEIVTMNREFGFGQGKVIYGRYLKAVEAWLWYREQNPHLLESAVKAGYRSTIRRLAQQVGYKPESPEFFRALRWKQKQGRRGDRTMALGETYEAPPTWAGLSEAEVCERIVSERPSWKQLTSLVTLTPAIATAAVEAGVLSDKDLIIATETFESLGLLETGLVKVRWEEALRRADDLRSANLAKNVRTRAVQEKLEAAADSAVQKAAEEATRGLEVFVFVDVSGSMEGAIDRAKTLLTRLLPAFPDVHVAVFNTVGRPVILPHPSAAGVRAAFESIRAGGGTEYGAGVRALRDVAIRPDRDALYIFVGDEGQSKRFESDVQDTRHAPVAFGLVPTPSPRYGRGDAVRRTAVALGIPCFEIDESMFTDAYATVRAIRDLIAATPVARAVTHRVALIDQILATPLLKRPAWR